MKIQHRAETGLKSTDTNGQRFPRKAFSPRRWGLLPLIPILALTCMAASCPSGAPLPSPKPGSWLVFLCKASDAPTEPHPVSYYKELFDRNQRDLLFDYFMEVSDGKADVSGTDVFGWFPMSVTTDAISPLNRNNTTNPNRAQTLQDCKSAGVAGLLAQGKSIRPDDYVGVIGIVNVRVDSGQGGRGLTANVDDVVSFFEHEMLHVYGLPHSNVMAADFSSDHGWSTGIDSQYNDCWDIMSYQTCTFEFNSGPHGGDGPELQIAYRNKLGWVPPTRIFTKSSQDTYPSTVTLAPVNEPSQSGSLMADVNIPNYGDYTIEYHVPSGFDRTFPFAPVIIRELRPDGKTYLVKRQFGKISFDRGETFTDLGNGISIHVDAIAAHSAAITITTHVSSPAAAGDRCGDKYVGVIKQCPAPTSCRQRTSPQVASIDYFCL